MRFVAHLLGILVCLFLFDGTRAEEEQGPLLNQLFLVIRDSLAESGAGERKQIYRQQHYRPGPGIASSVYSTLQTIVSNDQLECVSRLLCEASAGGSPGSTRQTNIDSQSLTTLLSYIEAGSGSASPLVTFGKAALLGMSHRGDSYSCYLNYPKCPKDQQRLLYYLNNHRGGFFRFFDMQQHEQNGQNGQNGLHYNVYLNRVKPGRRYLIHPEKYRTGSKPEVYAKKYDHSSMSFSWKDYKTFSAGSKKSISFPAEKRWDESEPRIQTKKIKAAPANSFSYFDAASVGAVKNFFPSEKEHVKGPVALVTDRLPNMFFFPEENSYRKGKQMKFPTSHTINSFVFRDF